MLDSSQPVKKPSRACTDSSNVPTEVPNKGLSDGYQGYYTRLFYTGTLVLPTTDSKVIFFFQNFKIKLIKK